MNNSKYEEHLLHPLQTNIKQFKISITFLSGYNGFFKVTDKNNKFYFMKSITDEDGSIQKTIPPGAYEIESLNNETKRIIIDEGYYTENNYPFKIKPSFSTIGSIIEISQRGPIIIFMLDDFIRDPLGFNARTLYGKYNLSPNLVDFLSFDKNFLDCDIAQGLIFRGQRSRIFHNFSMDVDRGYKYIEKIRGGLQWYVMEGKDIISSNCFKLKNENNQLVSFNGQSITFRLSIKEV